VNGHFSNCARELNGTARRYWPDLRFRHHLRVNSDCVAPPFGLQHKHKILFIVAI